MLPRIPNYALTLLLPISVGVVLLYFYSSIFFSVVPAQIIFFKVAPNHLGKVATTDVEVHYTYEVAGVRYESFRVSMLDWPSSSYPSRSASRLLEPVKARSEAHYCTVYPAFSVLLPGMPQWCVLWLYGLSGAFSLWLGGIASDREDELASSPQGEWAGSIRTCLRWQGFILIALGASFHILALFIPDYPVPLALIPIILASAFFVTWMYAKAE